MKDNEVCGPRSNTANGYGAATYLKSFFSRDAFVETPIFPQSMVHSRFELSTRFFHFGDKTAADADTRAPPKIFKIHSLL